MNQEQLKQAAISIFQAGLGAVDPHAAVRSSLKVEGSQIAARSVGWLGGGP